MLGATPAFERGPAWLWRVSDRHAVESAAFICVWTGLSPAQRAALDIWGRFYMLSSHQGFLEASLIGGHAVIPFLQRYLSSACSWRWGGCGERGMEMICAAVAALGSLMERENERGKGAGGRWSI